MRLTDYLVSLVRTAVPAVVGYLLSLLSGVGIDLDPGALSTVVTGLFVGGYYAVARFLESKVPALGWLLGYPAAPKYEDR